MNEEDSEQIELLMDRMGFIPVASPNQARIILLNTCSVRKKPEDKAFSLLGELAPLKKARPDTVIGVCGCMAQARSDEILKRAPQVDFVMGTGDLGQLIGLVEQALHGKRRLKSVQLPERKGAVVDSIPSRSIPTKPKIKAFVPIQYGCDKFCTFCIVPTTRGRERSRPIQDVVEEVEAIASRGTKEVTLLGQTVNSYGKNLPGGKHRFSELLAHLGNIEGLERIRYMSPYPRDFSEDLIQTIAENRKVMEHCHMPLQSGSDSVLKRMHRVYSVKSYLEIIENLRSAIPQVGLTTDIIVGFPGETHEEFEETLALMKHIQFEGAYCFAYSIRPGTPAANMEQVPQEVKKERLNRLLEAQAEISRARHQMWVGKSVEVLIETVSHRDSSKLTGYSRENINVCFPGGIERIGRIAKVKVESAHQWGLSGQLCGKMESESEVTC